MTITDSSRASTPAQEPSTTPLPTIPRSLKRSTRRCSSSPRGVLAKELSAHLRSRRPIRRSVHNTTKGQQRSQIKDAVSIRERPPGVQDRAVPGHWEGDLLLGRGLTQIATVVERASRFTVLVAFDGRDMHTVAAALSAKMNQLPGDLRKSLTWDRGMELAAHADITAWTGLTVYFADPRSPWQRRHQREHQPPPAPILPQRHHPLPLERRGDPSSHQHHQQQTTQIPRMAHPRRSARRAPTLPPTSRCCDHQLNLVNTSRFATQSASPPTTSSRRSGPEATATTTRWPSRSSGSTRPSSSAIAAPGEASTTSNSPPWCGSTGSTTGACTTTTAASRQPKPNTSTTVNNTQPSGLRLKQNSLRETR